MKKNNIFGLLLIFVLALSNLGAVRSPDLQFPPGFDAEWLAQIKEIILSGNVIPNQLIIKIQPGTDLTNIKSCAGISNASSINTNTALGFQLLDLHDHPLLEAIQAILTCPGVVYVEPNYIYTMTDTIPNDTFYAANQYGLVKIRAPQGWDLSTGSTSIVIAILDTGADLDHPDLASKIVPGYDFVNNDSVPQDDNGHGSHVAGIAAAVSNNGLGVAGVSWGARIMPVKVLDSSGSGSSTNIANALMWAADQGVDVINMSFGSPSPSTTIQNAINYAYGKGVTLVAAVGNDGKQLPYQQCSFFVCTDYSFYPAAFDHVIAVGATDSSNAKASFSNYGTPLDVMAPGVSIRSTYFDPSDPNTNYYADMSGTSMSSPFVAGLAAILLGLPGVDTPEAVEQALKDSALDLGTPGRDNNFGDGLIQMDGAIQEVQPPPLPGAFGKTSPAQAATNQPTNPSLTWGTSSDAVSYEYCIDTVNDNTCAGSWTSTGANKTVNIQINSNATYYWQVRSKNGTGTTYADANQWWSFTTKSCSTLNITITPGGGGNVELTPSPDCQAGTKYTTGTNVNLNAVPASNYYRFINWGGDLGGTSATNSITMSSNHSVTANFEKSTFDDVPFDYSESLGGVTYFLHDHIQALFDNGIAAGTSTEPPLYSPTLNLDRSMAAVFMLRAHFGTSYTPPGEPYDAFGADDWSNNSWARPWAEGMWDEQLTAGCQTNPLKYCPDQTLPRVQAIIFGLHMKYDYYDGGGNLVVYEPPPATGDVFADMTDVNYYGTKWAEAAYTDGLLPICGESAGKPLFCPEDPVDRAWAAYMIVQAKGLALP